MAVDIVMPQMGESIFEGTITKWLKKPGDKVERDEPLFEISTDKVDAEIPSPSAGVLKEIKVGEGQTVPIQTVVGVIDADGSAVAAPAKATTPALHQRQLRGRAHRLLRHVPPLRCLSRQAPQASGFIVLRWCAAWPRSTASIFPPSPARARAGASASRISRR